MSEFIEIRMRIEKVFDGSEMKYDVINSSETDSKNFSEKFKKVLSEDWDIDVDEYSEFVRTVVGEEDIIFED